MNWKFIDQKGSFKLSNADKSNYLYFPLANERGMMSAITPGLAGDIKSDQNRFLLQPVSVEDLHNSRSNRNFWLNIEGYGPWSVTGNSARQTSEKFQKNGSNDIEKVEVEAGFLWHKVTRIHEDLNIRAEISNYVPSDDDLVELMKVTITNTGKEAIRFIPTAAIPIYGRSADNLRDHRHVTSLLHQIRTNDYGVIVKPTLSFDERGHQENNTSYAVLASGIENSKPVGFCPVLQDFIGEGGTLDWPRSIVEDNVDYVKSNYESEGYESIGAIRFKEIDLESGDSVSFVITMIIDQDERDMNKYVEKYCSIEAFDQKLDENKEYWQQKLGQLNFYTGNKTFDNWMKWISLQPILRRIYGCSFLPHHDYGRGGRGWRDLWQDCLALLLMENEDVHDLLYSNFAGVRIDGSNATIIGNKPGDFVADRNNISRLWIDHGAWPLQTSSLYINMTGDLNFLLEKQSYFKDKQISFTRDIDEKWVPEQGNKLRNQNDEVYQGTILEHILLENLTVFFNVGEHNNIRLEDADWNDALDMASDRGESVAFTAYYAGNLKELINLLEKLRDEKNVYEVELLEEIEILLDSLNNSVNYDSVEEKNKRLDKYFSICQHSITGNKVKIKINDLINDIKQKLDWMLDHLRTEEWTGDEDGLEWFNGYYDNNGRQVDGSGPVETRMTLTGQVFPTMFGVATDAQVKKITEAADKYLYDQKIGGYRLNTRFEEEKLQLGRGFGFAYGHKENGAMFSHMAIMYANALYRRNYVKEGYRVWNSIYCHCLDFEKSRIYPGIPEYINERGRGLYSFLTGSASWLLLTMVTEVFGIKGHYGDLKLEPKLLKEQFDSNGIASIKIIFAGRELEIEYWNKSLLEYGNYSIKNVQLNGSQFSGGNISSFIIPENNLPDPLEGRSIITVELG
ncbi:MAG: GH36-type glycosyl hydrolase domain-containing protein [Halanaerobiales bacterium]